MSGGPDIVGYNVRHQVTGSGSGSWTTVQLTGTGLTTMISGLQAGTGYTVQVQTRNGETPSLWSLDGTGTTGTTTTTSTDATLSALALSGVTLDQNFAPATEDYTATVVNSVMQTTVTATTAHSGATVAFKDGDDNALTNPVTLDVGDNVIKAVVTAEDTTTTKTYMVTVTREATTTTVPVTIEAQHEKIGGGLEDLNFTLTREGDTTAMLVATVTITQEQSWLSDLEYTVTFQAGDATAPLMIEATEFSFTPLHHGRPHRHGVGRRHRRRLGHGADRLDLGAADHGRLRQLRIHLRGEHNGRGSLPCGDARCGLSAGAVAGLWF